VCFATLFVFKLYKVRAPPSASPRPLVAPPKEGLFSDQTCVRGLSRFKVYTILQFIADSGLPFVRVTLTGVCHMYVGMQVHLQGMHTPSSTNLRHWLSLGVVT
jgi:hypothetical protein